MFRNHLAVDNVFSSCRLKHQHRLPFISKKNTVFTIFVIVARFLAMLVVLPYQEHSSFFYDSESSSFEKKAIHMCVWILKESGREKSLNDHLKICNRGKSANPVKNLRTSGRDPYPVLPNEDCRSVV